MPTAEPTGYVQDRDAREAIAIRRTSPGFNVVLYHGCGLDENGDVDPATMDGAIKWWAPTYDRAIEKRDELAADWGGDE